MQSIYFVGKAVFLKFIIIVCCVCSTTYRLIMRHIYYVGRVDKLYVNFSIFVELYLYVYFILSNKYFRNIILQLPLSELHILILRSCESRGRHLRDALRRVRFLQYILQVESILLLHVDSFFQDDIIDDAGIEWLNHRKVIYQKPNEVIVRAFNVVEMLNDPIPEIFDWDDPDITQIMLMHDVELNPGPIISKLSSRKFFRDEIIRSICRLGKVNSQMFSMPSVGLDVNVTLPEETRAKLIEIVSSGVLRVDTNLSTSIDKVVDLLKQVPGSSDSGSIASGVAGVISGVAAVTEPIKGVGLNFDSLIKDKRICLLISLTWCYMVYTRGLDTNSTIMGVVLAMIIYNYHSQELQSLGFKMLSLFQCNAQSGSTFWEDCFMPFLTSVLPLNGTTQILALATASFKQLVAIEKTLTSFSKVFKMISDTVIPILAKVAMYMGFEAEGWLKTTQISFDKISERVLQLLTKFESNKCKISADIIRDYYFVNEEIKEFMSSLKPSAENAFLRNSINTVVSSLTKLKNCMEAGANDMVKPQPFMVYVYGNSGCGKTTYLTNFLMPSLICEMLPPSLLPEYRKKPSRFSWEKDSGKFWDGYTQNVVGVFISDMLSKKDTPGGDDSEASVLIQALGSNMFKLPMAELSLKKDSYFVSQIILAASNVRYINGDIVCSINNYDALCRRINACAFEMTLRDEYMDAAGKCDYPKIMRETIARGGLFPDYATFTRIDVRSPSVNTGVKPVPEVGKVYSMHEFSQYCLEQVRLHKSQQDFTADSLEAYWNLLMRGNFDEVLRTGHPVEAPVVEPQSGVGANIVSENANGYMDIIEEIGKSITSVVSWLKNSTIDEIQAVYYSSRENGWLRLFLNGTKTMAPIIAGVTVLAYCFDWIFPKAKMVGRQIPVVAHQMLHVSEDVSKAASAVLKNCVNIRIGAYFKEGVEYSADCHGVFVRGRFLAVPNHFITKLNTMLAHSCYSSVRVLLREYKSNGTDEYCEYVYGKGRQVYKVEAPHLASRDVGILEFASHSLNSKVGIFRFFPSKTWRGFLKTFDTGMYNELHMFWKGLGELSTFSSVEAKCTPFVPVTAESLLFRCSACCEEVSMKSTLSELTYRISQRTTVGDCGILGFTVDRSRLAYQSTWKEIANPQIMYFHVAGHGGTGLGVRLYKEDFEFLKPEFTSFEIDEMIPQTIRVIHEIGKSHGLIPSHEPLTTFLNEGGGNSAFHGLHKIVGTFEDASPACRSKIEKAPLHNFIPSEFRGFRKPAKLTPSKLADGSFYYPMKEGLMAYGTCEINVDTSTIDVFGNMVAQTSFDEANAFLKVRPQISRPLEYNEILEGIPGMIGSIDRTSSAGPLYGALKRGFIEQAISLNKVVETTGMKWIWGSSDRFDIANPVALTIKEIFDAMDTRIRNGEIVLNLYSASLKDECVSLEKQEKKSVRIFFAGNIHITMLYKKYFGMYLAWRKNTRFARKAQVGINCHTEFTRLLTEFESFNDVGIFSDFSKFDKKMRFVFLDTFFKEAEMFYLYDTDPESCTARRVLREMARVVYIKAATDYPYNIMEVIDPVCHGGQRSKNCNYIFEMSDINISGNYCTADMNSSASETIIMYGMYLLLLKRRPELKTDLSFFLDLRRMITLVVYGDDSVTVLHRDLERKYFPDGFDFTEFAKVVKSFGFVVTNECDDKELVRGMTRLEDGAFLARSFRKEKGVVYAPLRLESVYNILAYTERKNSVEENLQKVSVMLIELSAHGRSFFEEVITIANLKHNPLYTFTGPRYKHILQCCVEVFGRLPPVCTFEEAVSLLGTDKYAPVYGAAEVSSTISEIEL